MTPPRLIPLAGAVALALLAPLTASAQLVLVETGGTFRTDATNVAAASQGAQVIFSTELYEYGHFASGVNDGIYGNASSWIGGIDAYGWDVAWVGVIFSSPTAIGSFAFGRDNTGEQESRATWAGYIIQYTTDPVNIANAAGATWTTIQTLDYFFSPPADPHLRHLYELTNPLSNVTAFRILTSSGLSYGNAIDEIEVYAAAGTVIPEPSTYAALAGLGALGLALWRRRRAA